MMYPHTPLTKDAIFRTPTIPDNDRAYMVSKGGKTLVYDETRDRWPMVFSPYSEITEGFLRQSSPEDSAAAVSVVRAYNLQPDEQIPVTLPTGGFEVSSNNFRVTLQNGKTVIARRAIAFRSPLLIDGQADLFEFSNKHGVTVPRIIKNNQGGNFIDVEDQRWILYPCIEPLQPFEHLSDLTGVAKAYGRLDRVFKAFPHTHPDSSLLLAVPGYASTNFRRVTFEELDSLYTKLSSVEKVTNEYPWFLSCHLDHRQVVMDIASNLDFSVAFDDNVQITTLDPNPTNVKFREQDQTREVVLFDFDRLAYRPLESAVGFALLHHVTHMAFHAAELWNIEPDPVEKLGLLGRFMGEQAGRYFTYYSETNGTLLDVDVIKQFVLDGALQKVANSLNKVVNQNKFDQWMKECHWSCSLPRLAKLIVDNWRE